MKILILEDDNSRILKFREQFFDHDHYITRFPKEANKWLEEIEFNVITLDHDLEEESQGTDNNFEEGTGLEVANFLGQNLELSKEAQIFIHSLNGAGANRMQAALRERGQVPHIPFLWLKEIQFTRG
jgi:hypothetical protein